MKKAIIICGLLTGLATTQLQAQTDSSKMAGQRSSKVPQGSTKYFYYPEANVYFNEANANYLYFDAATSTWMSNPQLPSTYSININSPKTEIMYNGADVW